MDSRLAPQPLVFCLLFLLFMVPCLAYNEQAPRTKAPPLTKFALQSRLSGPANANPAPLPASKPVTQLATPESVPAPASFLASPVSLTGLNTLSFTPQQMLLNRSDLFALLPSRYQIHIELTPSGPANSGNPRLSAYSNFQLSPQSSLGLSLKNLSPRLKFDRPGLQTELKFRGDGIKLNFRPTAISNQLEIDVKITDDESRLDLTYRY
ncbi:hypothetical protein [Oceanisphaera sp. W20_SRM_FM3]|uniref:hypothetical protein n=1 Tax=Oceanisphaera sp. W20_SRM_FM3 TaxID=3240267 RepID=UPI003F9D1B8E